MSTTEAGTTQQKVVAFLPMEIFNAVYLAGGVHSKWDPIQTPVADHASETLRMVGLPHRS